MTVAIEIRVVWFLTWQEWATAWSLFTCTDRLWLLPIIESWVCRGKSWHFLEWSQVTIQQAAWRFADYSSVVSKHQILRNSGCRWSPIMWRLCVREAAFNFLSPRLIFIGRSQSLLWKWWLLRRVLMMWVGWGNFCEIGTDFNSKRDGRSWLCCIQRRLSGNRGCFARWVILG